MVFEPFINFKELWSFFWDFVASEPCAICAHLEHYSVHFLRTYWEIFVDFFASVISRWSLVVNWRNWWSTVGLPVFSLLRGILNFDYSWKRSHRTESRSVCKHDVYVISKEQLPSIGVALHMVGWICTELKL
jgi:hypothetical protein